MMMSVDKAGTDNFASTVDDPGVLVGRIYLRGNVGDKTVADQDAVIPQTQHLRTPSMGF